jgi:RND family efflux transporter MFP subunit
MTRRQYRWRRPLLVLTVAVAMFGCTPRETTEEAGDAPPTAAEKTGPETVTLEGEALTLAGIEVGAAQEREIDPRIAATGRVEATPSGEAHVTSRVEGRVVKLLATVGDRVRVGQALAVIESEKLHVAQLAHQLAVKRTELARKNRERQRRLAALGAFSHPEREAARTRFNEADVAAARAALVRVEAAQGSAASRLRSAEAALTAARKQREIAARARDRAEAVYRGGYLTGKEVVAADSAYEQARIEEAGALDDVQLLGGKPGDLHEVPVVAPIAGRITERTASLGETVNAERTLFHILSADVVWVTLDVFPADVPRLRVGQAVAFRAEGQEGRAVSGNITSIADTADAKTRTVRVRCRVANPEGRLRPGTAVTGTIATGGFRSVTVPAAAVQEVEGRSVVYVPGKGAGQFVARPVTVGATRDDYVVIESGLAAGEKVVVRNAFILKSQAMKAELGEE